MHKLELKEKITEFHDSYICTVCGIECILISDSGIISYQTYYGIKTNIIVKSVYDKLNASNDIYTQLIKTSSYLVSSNVFKKQIENINYILSATCDDILMKNIIE